MSDINLLEQVQNYYQTHSKEEIDKVWKEVENENSNNIDLYMEEQIKEINNWTEVTPGVYSLVIAENGCYQIIVDKYEASQPIETAIGSLCICAYSFDSKIGKHTLDRVYIAREKNIEVLLQMAVLDYNVYFKEKSFSEMNDDEILFYINSNCKTDYKSLDVVNGKQVSYCQLSEEFIKMFQDKLNWSALSACQTLSEDLIREFQDKVEWEWISKEQKLSEDFIREFKEKVDWYYISISQTLSEDFIREFQDKVDWEEISWYQTLSENFIREFQDYVHWDYILSQQTLSSEFRQKFIHKLF